MEEEIKTILEAKEKREKLYLEKIIMRIIEKQKKGILKYEDDLLKNNMIYRTEEIKKILKRLIEKHLIYKNIKKKRFEIFRKTLHK